MKWARRVFFLLVCAVVPTARADVYLVAENPNAAAPYDSWATAATDYATAFAALTSGNTLWISNGNYSVASNAGTIPANAHIRTVNGPTVTKLSITGGGNSRNGFYKLNAGVTISGLHIYNVNGVYSCAAWLQYDGNVVSNCIIDACSQLGGTGGIIASKGLVVDCVITNCDGCGWSGDCHGPRQASISGTAVMDRCRIVGRSSAYPSRGVIAVAGSAILRNTLIQGNNVKGVSGIYLEGSGTVENCTIVDNITRGSASSTTYSYNYPASALYVASLTATVRNTIIHSNVDTADAPANEAGVTGYGDRFTTCFFEEDGDPCFEDAAVDNFHLQPVSPCVNAGTYVAWMDTALDLDLNPRLNKGAVDIGCYEYTPSKETGAAIYHTMIGSTVFAPQTNELFAVITPEGLDYDPAKCWWTFDGTEPSASNHQAVGPTVTNAFPRGKATVRFRFEYGGKTYGADKYDWFDVKSAYIYLVKTNPNAAAPYDTWETAGTTFASVFAYLGEGMTMVVSNGTFALGAVRTLPKYATVMSANGPTNTTLSAPSNSGAFNLSNLGSAVVGVTLPNYGYVGSSAINMTQDCRIENCIFKSCSAHNHPGGVYATAGDIIGCEFISCGGYGWGTEKKPVVIEAIGDVFIDRCIVRNGGRTTYENYGVVGLTGGAKIRNSFIFNNSGAGCVGIYAGANCSVENCTVVSNKSTSTMTTSYAVYAADATAAITNAIVAGNKLTTTGADANAGGPASCYVTSFTTGDPIFADIAKGDYSLDPESPCIGAGTYAEWMDDALDLAGNPRINEGSVDLGCYEYYESPEIKVTLKKTQLGSGSTGSTYAPCTYEFTASIRPKALEYDEEDLWWTFDGTVPTAMNHAAVGKVVTNVFWAATNKTWTISFTIAARGEVHTYVQTNWFTVLSDVFYVRKVNPNAAPPYATWATAATNIGHAYSQMGVRSTLWIDDGYWVMKESTVKTLTLTDYGSIRSVNGPEKTTLDCTGSGAAFAFGWVSPYSSSYATISGFRVINATGTWSPGVLTENFNASRVYSVVTNCIFENCRDSKGVEPGAISLAGPHTIVDCVFSNCASGVYCTSRGQAVNMQSANGLIERCKFYDTRCSSTSLMNHGAVSLFNGATMRNSLVAGCQLAGCSGVYVAGASKVENCTVAGNVTFASTASGAYGPCALYVAGTNAVVVNTIVAGNVDGDGAVADAGGDEDCYENCAVPAGYGSDCVTGDPKFKDAENWDFHLWGSSPCINAARYLDWMANAKDLDGRDRVLQKYPDIGCYESPHKSGLFILYR